MTPSSPQTDRNHESAKRSFVVLPFIIVCSVACAGCIMFGNPTLWLANAENLPDARPPASGFLEAPTAAPLKGDFKQLDCIGEYKAISQSDQEDRATNLKLAAQSINGYEIKPGETMSVNSLFGDTEHDDRYKMAAVINDAKLEEGRGGGICQVSTALYIAALRANLEIVERHPHSFVTDYAPIGLDATLVYGVMDLRIKNNTDTSVFVGAEALGQSVEVKLYGHASSGGISVDATSKVLECYDATGAKVSAVQNGETPPATDKSIFYVTESSRTYYQDGVKMRSDHLSTDTYEVPPSATVVLAEGSVDPTK